MRRTTIAAVAAAAVAAAPAAVAAGAGTGGLPLGPATHAGETTYLGYYDGHKDVFLATDTSSKTQAKAMHINYSAALGAVKGAPRQFFVMGRAAHGQLSVFGSEPGESDYNPLWEEVAVTWKASAKPVLLVKDDQIDELAKKGELSERDLHVVLNAPITRVLR